jgi:glucokinase
MKHRIALDIGGTKTHIALFSITADHTLELIRDKKYNSQEAKNLEEILLDFHSDYSLIDSICIAVAGPVIGDEAQLTNVVWRVNKTVIAHTTGVQNIHLLNDLEASALGIPFMASTDMLSIYDGIRQVPGNAAIIAPGTGLGEAAMYWDGSAYHPFASEGGHCDFSPRDRDDFNLLMFLQHKYGRVSWERLISGMGIANIFDYLRTSSDHHIDSAIELKYLTGDVAANVSKGAVNKEPIAVETMELFVRYLAIEAANMALKFKCTGGLYIGGGIIPKIWNDHYKSIFLKHFFDVGRLEPLLRCINVTIILNPASVLMGAAHYGPN